MLATFLAAYGIAQYGLQAFFVVFSMKTAVLIGMIFLLNQTQQKEFYYYYNQGWSKTKLWTMVIVFDLLSFFVFVYAANKIYDASIYFR